MLDHIRRRRGDFPIRLAKSLQLIRIDDDHIGTLRGASTADELTMIVWLRAESPARLGSRHKDRRFSETIAGIERAGPSAVVAGCIW